MYIAGKKKSILLLIFISVFFISIILTSSQTYAKEYDIKNLNDFKSELNNLVSENKNVNFDNEQIKQLVDKTSPQVIESFLEEKLNAVQDYLDRHQNLDLTTDNKIIDLGDNCTLNIGSSEVNSEIALASTPGAQTLWKDYGSRKYTCTFKGEFLIASFSLNLCNHYTLSSKGITPRYPEAWGDGAGFLSVTHGKINEPKRSAKKGETVSMNCIFKVKANVGPGTGEKSIRMNNFVKCSDIDTIEKQVKVVQSWRGDYL